MGWLAFVLLLAGVASATTAGGAYFAPRVSCTPAATHGSSGALECGCTLLAEGEGEGEGEPDLGLGRTPLLSTRVLRHALPLAALLLVLSMNRRRASSRAESRWPVLLLACCALLGLASHANFGQWPHRSFVNAWEFFHYYLGSKYLPELGYTGLYSASLVADEETGLLFESATGMVRDLETAGCTSLESILAQKAEVRARFTEERWETFLQDIRHFKGELGRERWSAVFQDKGYNATPLWSAIVGPLTNWIPTSKPNGLLALALIDPLLMLCASLAVWRVFDARVALLMLILFATHMTMSHSHMKGALLRADWVVALVVGVCALKAQRPGIAGACVAWAAAARVFPVFFALGLLGAVALAWLLRQPVRRSQLRFCWGFSAGLFALSAGALFTLGMQPWLEFCEKIFLHNDSFSPWRVGFKHLFLGAHSFRTGASHQAVFHARWLGWWVVQAVLGIGFVLATRRLKDWQILACGFVPTFLLVAPTYYYFIMLIVPLLFFAERVKRVDGFLGLGWLFASSSIAYVLTDSWGRELKLFYALSVMMLVVCLLLMYSAWRAAAETRRPELSSVLPSSAVPADPMDGALEPRGPT